MRTRGAGGEARQAHGRGHAAHAGWTLLEIVVAMAILLIVLVGFSYGLVSSSALEKANREQGLAREAARAKIEELRATIFEEVFARYGGESPESRFDVRGLAARPDDPDRRVGAILFPVSEDGELREDLELPRLGTPRDLTGEGDFDALDHALDYRLLPVLVRIEWRGAAGDATFEMGTMLKRMRP